MSLMFQYTSDQVVSAMFRVYRFDEIMKFVIDVVGMLEIGPDKTRVAVITFSDETVVKFHLNRYNTIKDVQDAVLVIEFPGGKTNISGSLRVLIDTMYLPQNGGRANAQKVRCTQLARCVCPHYIS